MEQGFITEPLQKHLKLLLCGFPGSGKSYSACRIAQILGKKFCVINTEKRRGLLYQKEFGYSVYNILPPYSPEKYVQAIDACVKAGFELVVIDSLSHEWMGKGGASHIVSNSGAKDTMKAWHDFKTGRHQDLIEKIMEAPIDVIATARSNFEYDEVEVNGKMRRVKSGTGIQQEKSTEFEFDFVFEFGADYSFRCTKSSTGSLKVFEPGYDYFIDEPTVKRLYDWVSDTPQEEKSTGFFVKGSLDKPVEVVPITEKTVIKKQWLKNLKKW